MCLTSQIKDSIPVMEGRQEGTSEEASLIGFGYGLFRRGLSLSSMHFNIVTIPIWHFGARPAQRTDLHNQDPTTAAVTPESPWTRDGGA